MPRLLRQQQGINRRDQRAPEANPRPYDNHRLKESGEFRQIPASTMPSRAPHNEVHAHLDTGLGRPGVVGRNFVHGLDALWNS